MALSLHSRHIPREHLDFSNPTAHTVERGGLCDVLDPATLARMKALGISVIETRLVWNELEGENAPGWDALEVRLSAIEAAGLTPGLFCWFQHPPKGAQGYTRLRCLEHGEDSTIVSFWDPGLRETYDRLYGELAARFGARIGFLYIGVFGDYGEVCYPSGVKHYTFSPPHGHHGFWSGDKYARRDFSAFLQKKYGTLDTLNAAWGSSFGGWDEDTMPLMPFDRNPLLRRADYMDWYTGALAGWCDTVCAIAEKWFPAIPKGLPMGFVDESLQVGQVKSRIAGIAAAHGVTARWTDMAFLGEFSRSDVLAKRISSAALYYGAPFGTEAALTLEAENAANAAYECIANKSSLVHNDPTNIFLGGKLWQSLMDGLRLSTPIRRTGVFYPVEGEMLEMLDTGGDGFAALAGESGAGTGEGEASPIGVFVNRCAALRHGMDYALFDTTMAGDGYLNLLRRAVFLISAPIPAGTCALLEAFAAKGGILEAKAGVALTVLETGEVWDPPALTHPLQILPDAEYRALSERYDPEGRRFFTIHADFISVYDPVCAAGGDAEGAVRYLEKDE